MRCWSHTFTDDNIAVKSRVTAIIEDGAGSNAGTFRLTVSSVPTDEQLKMSLAGVIGASAIVTSAEGTINVEDDSKMKVTLTKISTDPTAFALPGCRGPQGYGDAVRLRVDRRRVETVQYSVRGSGLRDHARRPDYVRKANGIATAHRAGNVSSPARSVRTRCPWRRPGVGPHFGGCFRGRRGISHRLAPAATDQVSVIA